jgi:hypothetical protein
MIVHNKNNWCSCKLDILCINWYHFAGNMSRCVLSAQLFSFMSFMESMMRPWLYLDSILYELFNRGASSVFWRIFFVSTFSHFQTVNEINVYIKKVLYRWNIKIWTGEMYNVTRTVRKRLRIIVILYRYIVSYNSYRKLATWCRFATAQLWVC